MNSSLELVLVSMLTCVACGSDPQPDSAPAPAPAKPEAAPEPEPEPEQKPEFAALPEDMRAKLELYGATVQLPPDYRVVANKPGARVDFIARPPSGEFALLYDFGAPPADSPELEPIL
jgi:hypothetical protein